MPTLRTTLAELESLSGTCREYYRFSIGATIVLAVSTIVAHFVWPQRSSFGLVVATLASLATCRVFHVLEIWPAEVQKLMASLENDEDLSVTPYRNPPATNLLKAKLCQLASAEFFIDFWPFLLALLVYIALDGFQASLVRIVCVSLLVIPTAMFVTESKHLIALSSALSQPLSLESVVISLDLPAKVVRLAIQIPPACLNAKVQERLIIGARAALRRREGDDDAALKKAIEVALASEAYELEIPVLRVHILSVDDSKPQQQLDQGVFIGFDS